MSNFYEILNVNMQSSDDEIKKTFRKLSLQNHPDNTYTLEELYLKKILFPNQITSFFSSYN